MMRTLIFIFGLLISVGVTHAATPRDPAEHAWQIINDAFKDSNPDKRKEIVQAASLAAPDQKIHEMVGKALRDPDAQVRLTACQTLTSWRDKRTIPLFRAALKDEVPEVGFCAAQALWQLDDPVGRAALLAVVQGQTKASSGYIAKQKRDALRMLKTPATLIGTLTRFGVGFAPVPGLGTGLSSLEGLMKNGEVTPRAIAVLDLASDKKPETLQVLRDALNDKEWSVRAAAVHALAIRNQNDVLDQLIPLLDDKKDAVSDRAAVAYLRLSQGRKGRPSTTAPQLVSQTSSVPR